MQSELERLKQNRHELRECVVALIGNPAILSFFNRGTSTHSRPLTSKRIVDFARDCIEEIKVHSLEI